MDEEYLEISLWIVSKSLEVTTISQLIGLQPSYSQNQGDQVGQTNRRYEENSWNLADRLYVSRGDLTETQTVTFFDTFFAGLVAYGSRIKQLSLTNCVNIDIFYNVSASLSIGLTQNQIDAISSIGASLTIDIMTP